MDEPSFSEPLLLNQDVGYIKEPPLLVSWAKWILKIAMWMVFIAWIVLIFLHPGEFGSDLIRKWTKGISETSFGPTGSLLLTFSGPVLIISILAVAYVIISGEEVPNKRKTSKFPSYRLWTFPVLVDGPFGVVSAAEFLCVVLFATFLLWAVYAYTMRNLSLLDKFHLLPKDYGTLLLEFTGLRSGMIGLFCMAFLFLPIARGSVLLRLIDIPFEHATRYHVWLGHITMMFFTFHGLCFIIGWSLRGRLAHELMEWRSVGIANLPGVIALLAGLLMWVTSLGPVRKHYFEFFFYTHQLYVVFVVFLALHVGDFLFSTVAGGIFLFILDRFLRFCQSRKTVNVLSAKSLPSGTLELVLSKPANLRYNALSFIFLQVRELSWLQWHPFSVSSSPTDGKYHIAVLIQVLGGWTAKLRENVLKISEADLVPQKCLPSEPCLKITASVEGPYGHESPYHLMYEDLILVAGGIGISPFLAILSDILHRIKEGKHCLPRKVLVVWAIKKSDELSLLSTINMELICPSFSNKLELEILVYVTRQSEPPLEEGLVHKDPISSICQVSNGDPMSGLVGTGDNLWSGLYIISSILGFIVLLALLDIFYINKYNITVWWYKGLLLLACMVASVLVFGGIVVGLWHLWEQKMSGKEAYVNEKAPVTGSNQDGSAEHEDLGSESLKSLTTIRYGSRPDFKELFGSGKGKWGGVDVGVIVCGPPTLQSSVAKEIRSHNLQRMAYDPIFHFNRHSFDL